VAPTKNQMQIMFTRGIAPKIVHFKVFRPFSLAKRYAPTAMNSDMNMSGRREIKTDGSFCIEIVGKDCESFSHAFEV